MKTITGTKLNKVIKLFKVKWQIWETCSIDVVVKKFDNTIELESDQFCLLDIKEEDTWKYLGEDLLTLKSAYEKIYR